MCYKCGAPATSKEHVPPLCLFPEEKDIKTSIFRNNLTTVPSCDLHNSKKSMDDEFLMAVLAGIVGNNVIGFFHNMTKVKRALERKGGDMAHVFQQGTDKNTRSPVEVMLNGSNFSRIKSCFEYIAYGLYYHKYGYRFEGECKIVLDFVRYEDERMEKYRQVCRKRWEHEQNKPDGEGNNPEIFRYEFYPPDRDGLIALIFTFYEGATVFIVFRKDGVEMPYNLTRELIESGIKTTISFPDDSFVEFN